MNNDNKKEKDLFYEIFKEIKEFKFEPLSDSDFNHILESYELDEANYRIDEDKYVKIMKETYDKMIEYEKKLTNKTSIRSFGELLHIVCEYYEIAVDRLAFLLDLTQKEMVEYFQDNRSIFNLGIKRILNLCALINVNIEEIISILERTIRLKNIKDEICLNAGYARANKDIGDSKRDNIMNDAMKELLLKVEEPEIENDTLMQWNNLKKELQIEIQKDESLDFNTKGCFTIISDPTNVQLKKQYLKMI